MPAIARVFRLNDMESLPHGVRFWSAHCLYQDRGSAGRKGHAATATFGVTFGSNPSDFSVDWMVGKPPVNEVSEAFEIDDSKLGIARAYMESGQSLDSICALINPEYRNWSAERQRAFQADLQTRLSAMKPVDET